MSIKVWYDQDTKEIYAGNKSEASAVSFNTLEAVATYMDEHKVSEFITAKGALKYEQYIK